MLQGRVMTQIQTLLLTLSCGLGMQKYRSNRQDLDELMLDYYKKETILASKICLHERLNKSKAKALRAVH